MSTATNGDKSLKQARNILELESTFTETFGKQASMTTTARQSHYMGLDGKIDRKILNIIKKLKTRFNPDQHRANNEKMLQRMRVKAVL